MRCVNCRRCGVVAVEEVPWADGKRTLTKAYMLFLARWARRLSWKGTAEAFRTSWDKVFDAVEHVVSCQSQPSIKYFPTTQPHQNKARSPYPPPTQNPVPQHPSCKLMVV